MDEPTIRAYLAQVALCIGQMEEFLEHGRQLLRMFDGVHGCLCRDLEQTRPPFAEPIAPAYNLGGTGVVTGAPQDLTPSWVG